MDVRYDAAAARLLIVPTSNRPGRGCEVPRPGIPSALSARSPRSERNGRA